MAKKMERGTATAPKKASTAVVVANNTEEGKLVALGSGSFKVKRVVTLPLLKHVDGQVVHVQIASEIYVGKQIPAEKGSTKAAEKPADLCDVVELNTARKMQYIVSAVVKSNLETTYPDGGYVGKCFAIFKGEKREGKRYREYEIVEIEKAEAA